MELDERFADKVAELCYQKYQSLPKKGKPQKNKEWTLLSCVVFTRMEVLLLSVQFILLVLPSFQNTNKYMYIYMTQFFS